MEIKEIQGTSSNSRRFKEILEIQGAPGSLGHYTNHMFYLISTRLSTTLQSFSERLFHFSLEAPLSGNESKPLSPSQESHLKPPITLGAVHKRRHQS